MTALAEVLAQVDSVIDDAHRSEQAANNVIALLETAGAQIGALQIGCCAPNRLPLYAEMLAQLTAVQLEVNRSIGRDH